VVSRAGTAPLRALATETGLAGAVAGVVLLGTYPGFPVHAPRQIFADPAVAIAGGAAAVTGIEVLRRREALFGRRRRCPLAWRLLDRIDEPDLERVRAAQADAGSGPDRSGGAGTGDHGARLPADAGHGRAGGCDWCGEPGSG
jgi:hypothetical protein